MTRNGSRNEDIESSADLETQAEEESLASLSESRDRYCVSFVAAIKSPLAKIELSRALTLIGGSQPAIAEFKTLDELFAALREENGESLPRKNAILCALLRSVQISPRDGALKILAVVMLPGLLKMYGEWRRGNSVESPDDLFAGLWSAFSTACTTYPIERRQQKVAANLLGETRRFKSKWNAVDRRVRIAKERLVDRVLESRGESADGVVDDEPSGDFTEVGPRVSPDSLARILDEADRSEPIPAPYSDDELENARHLIDGYCRGGFIDEEEGRLLLETAVLDRSINDLASELKQKADAVRKKRDRALGRISGGTPRVRKRTVPSGPKTEGTPTCMDTRNAATSSGEREKQ